MKKIIIVAVAKNNVIGRSNGEIPWHSKEDFQHFKNTTLGFPVIMGRKTFESLGKPLKNRLNIILTKKTDVQYDFDNVLVFHSLNDAYLHCEKNNYEKAFVIGGGEIYNQAINTIDEMIISKMDFDADGDIYFPVIDESLWMVRSRDKRNGFEIFTYARN